MKKVHDSWIWARPSIPDQNLIKKFRRRRKRRDAEKNSDRPSDFNLPNIPHQTPVHNDEPLVSPFLLTLPQTQPKTSRCDILNWIELITYRMIVIDHE